MYGMSLWVIALILLFIAAILFIIGLKGIAGLTMKIAKWLVIFFIIIACLSMAGALL